MCPPLDIPKFLFATLNNQDKKVSLIQFDSYGALERSSLFMNKCHNIIIIVQTTGEDASFPSGKSKSSNNTLDNITIDLLLNSSHKKELWFFSYHYAICLSHQTENILRVDVTYFLWHGKIPSYKHIKIWGVRVYIINGRVKIKKLDDI